MRERLKKTMPSKAHHEILTAVGSICTQNLLLPIALVITVVGAVVTALVPPLILENIVDGLTAGNPMPIAQAFSYFGVTALAGLLESTRESLLIVFGQKLTHGLRSQMCEKLSQLSADTLSKMDAGTIASRFVGDVDTLETLFTSGIISMFADACTMIGIYAVLWQKNRGLAITLLAVLPLIALFTRHVQKKMLAAQMDSRKAVARTSGLVPETIHCIRMIHVFGKEGFMRKRYDRTRSRQRPSLCKTAPSMTAGAAPMKPACTLPRRADASTAEASPMRYCPPSAPATRCCSCARIIMTQSVPISWRCSTA